MTTLNRIGLTLLAASIGAVLAPSTARAEWIHGKWLGGGIYAKYRSMGFEKSPLGYPTSHELEAGRSPQGTTGRFVAFAGGYIIWHRTGRYANRSYEVHGLIARSYTQARGTNSWLGFPISDEYSVNGGRQSNFEGGYLFWNASTNQVSAGRYGGGATAKAKPTFRLIPQYTMNELGYDVTRWISPAWLADRGRFTTPVRYQVYDGTAGGAWLELRGKYLPPGRAHTLPRSDIAWLRFNAPRYNTADYLWVRVQDTDGWTAWQRMTVYTRLARRP